MQDDNARDEFEREHARKQRLYATEGGRRLVMCRCIGEFVECVGQINASAHERQELMNLANVLLRMAILKNDGGPVSYHKVPAF